MFALLALVGAVSGVVTASASAARPEYAVWPNKITKLSSGEIILETAGAKTPSVRCKSSQATTVEATTFKSGFAEPAFKECKSSLGTSCKSTNTSVAGEIKTNLSWKLVYLSKATHEVGTLFQGREAMSGWTTFSCFGASITLRGSVLAKTTPVNVKANPFTLALQGAHGKQEVTQYETEGGEKATAALELRWNEAASFEAASIGASLSEVWEKENEIIA
jgi:hypothetical protein